MFAGAVLFPFQQASLHYFCCTPCKAPSTALTAACSFKHAERFGFFFCPQMFGCGAVAQLVLSKGTHGMFLTVNFAFGFAATLGILVCGQISGKPTCFFPSPGTCLGLFRFLGFTVVLYALAGGHLNPAVTFALCLLGRERWRKFPVYFLFQTIGAFFGAAIIFGMYYGKTRRWKTVARQRDDDQSTSIITCLGGVKKWNDRLDFFSSFKDALFDYEAAFDMSQDNSTAKIFATYPRKNLTIVNGFFDQVISWN